MLNRTLELDLFLRVQSALERADCSICGAQPLHHHFQCEFEQRLAEHWILQSNLAVDVQRKQVDATSARAVALRGRPVIRPIVLVGYAESLGAAKAAAIESGCDIGPNQESVAHGPANILSGLFGGPPGGAYPGLLIWRVGGDLFFASGDGDKWIAEDPSHHSPS